VQRHIDYITPGIKSLEVNGVKRARSTEKRLLGIPLPPILEPLTLPLSELLGDTLALCDVAVTPACISGMSTDSSRINSSCVCRYDDLTR
jgi:tripeptidyl-peptidase-1